MSQPNTITNIKSNATDLNKMPFIFLHVLFMVTLNMNLQ